MCEPKLRTPGIARSSLLARSVIRRIASSDVPGFSTKCIRKSFSWKFGQELLAQPRDGASPVSGERDDQDARPPATAGATSAGSIAR